MRAGAFIRELMRHARPFDAERRSLLRSGFATSVALGMAPIASCGGPADRIAVIGAGIAGLHCAHRLREAGVVATVFEAADRVGGRMATGRGLFLDDQICELGGELIDTNHAVLWGLAEELGLTMVDRWDSPGGETWWINGAEVPWARIAAQFDQLAPVIAADIDRAETSDEGFAELDGTTLADWLDAKVPAATYPDLRPAFEIEMVGEFGLELDQQSCLNLLYLVDPDLHGGLYGESDERWHTAEGNDEFPIRLAEGLGDSVITGSAVTAVRARGRAFEVTVSGPDGESTEVFDHVVFALPFSVLRDVDLDGVDLPDDKRAAIAELGYGTNAKVMIGFADKPWRDFQSNGELLCDLPIQCTWSSSIGQTGDSAILTNFSGGAQGVACGDGTAEAWAAVRLADLDAVWPGTSPRATGTVVRAHWPSEPLARGSYACYRPGQWRFYGVEGRREGNLHFCGEHCSLEFTGWMEGAAETGALVAAAILGDLGVTLPARLQAIVDLRGS